MIQALFEKVRRKQQQRTGTAFESYWQGAIARLAAGEHLDPEAVVQAAESIGRSPEIVEADVELYKSRSRMADELKSVPRWQSELAKLQATIDQAAAELEQHTIRLRAVIDAAYQARQEIENRIAGAAQHAAELAATSPNPALAQRETELQAQRRELQERRRPLFDSLGNGAGTLVGALSHAQRQLGEFEERAAAGDTDAREYVQRLEVTIQIYQTRIKQAESQLRDIDEQLRAINAELAEVRQRKLTP